MRTSSRFWLSIDRTLASKGWKQILIPVVLSLTALVLVFIVFWPVYGFGFDRNIPGAKDIFTPLNSIDAALYYIFFNNDQKVFPGGHLGGYVITLLGILCVSFLTAACTNLLSKRASGYINGETAYRLRDHIVILGTNDVIYSIIAQKAGEDCDILIQTTRNIEETRREILAFLRNKVDERHLIFIYGDRTSAEDIARLCLPKAREVFVIGDNVEKGRTESYGDAYNMDCINAVADYLSSLRTGAPGRKVPYHVLFEHQTTFAAFQFSDILNSIKNTVVFKPFNFYEMWAQQVLVSGHSGEINPGSGRYENTYKFLDTLPSGGHITEDSPETVHLIIIGMSKMGAAMAVEAAHLCHYANYVRDKSRKTTITFIDENADVQKDFFMGRFKELFRLSNATYTDADTGSVTSLCSVSGDADWLDIDWEFIRGRAEQPEIQKYLKKAAADRSRIVTIAVCFPESNQSIAAALYLPESVYENCLQILTYQRLSGYIVNNIAGSAEDNASYRYRCLRPFGMIDLGYDREIDSDSLAMMVDSVYQSGDWKLEKYDRQEYLGTWLDGKVSDRWSSVFNANAIGGKLRTAGVSADDDFDAIQAAVERSLPVLMQVEHNRWNIEKLLTGFRPLNDIERKEMEALLAKIPSDAEAGDESVAIYYGKRRELKGWPKRAHLDLCSCKELTRVDRWAIHYDADLCRSIPFIVRRWRGDSSNCTLQDNSIKSITY
jgi:hypothetical protein